MARPPKPINWDMVEKRIEAGNNGIQIATDLRISKDTFYDRFKEEYGVSFSDYSSELYSAGTGNLQFTQYMKALAGNINMLIFLGKERLGQGKEAEKLSPHDDIIEIRHENMILRNEIENLKAK